MRLVVAAALLLAIPDRATAQDLRTDVNIVTALDISESVDARSTGIEIEGMAQAILAPEILSAIQAGRHRRVGFAIFAWHEGAYPALISWTTIGSAEDARNVAARLRSDLPIQLAAAARLEETPRMTDLSGAIDHAAMLLLTAPFAADRSVLNVIGNGWDNVGEGPEYARDRLLGKGGVINGVIVGEDPGLLAYFRQNVIGGRGAFLLTAEDPSAIAGILARKFLRDVALGDSGPPQRPF